MPFAWITLASTISVPIAMYFQNGMEQRAGADLGLAYGTTWVVRDEFLSTIVVYILNLGAAIWFFNADGSTRWAAFWATAIGISKLVAPIALSTMSDVPVGGAQHYNDWQTLRILVWSQDLQFFALGIMLWAAFARFVGDSGPVAAHYAHAEA